MKKRVFAFVFALLIAVLIFNVSSLTMEPSGEKGVDLKPVFYHIAIFFFLASFLLIAFDAEANKFVLLAGILISILYGISDEIHQHFVPGRAMSPIDVFYDSVGVISASVFYKMSNSLFNKKV